MKKIVVFCGSGLGKRAEYAEGARDLGKALAEKDITLVFGAGSTGNMGAISNSVMDNGGKVIGITPEFFLKDDVIHKGLTELRVVDTMHQRKADMAEMADGFVAMPGGLGTFDELIEIMTWAQLELHQKPIGLLNINGYFDGFINFLRHTVEEEFTGSEHIDRVIVEADAERLLERMRE